MPELQSPDKALPIAIDAVGLTSFPGHFLTFLNSVFGVRHCVMYQFLDNEMQIVGSASADGSDIAGANSSRYRQFFWHRDHEYKELRQRSLSAGITAISCNRTEEISDSEFRHEMFFRQGLTGRAMVVGTRQGALFGVSMFRASIDGFFSSNEATRIVDWSDTVVSLVARHTELHSTLVDTKLTTPAQVEKLLLHHESLSERERSICARLVFGQRLKFIARELQISVESVSTYRKRAFIQLGINSREELVMMIMAHQDCPR